MISASFAALLQAFFTERLLQQRQASAHTIAGYRDTFRLLLQFAHKQLGKPPSKLAMEDLDAPFIGEFLTHLERDRGAAGRRWRFRIRMDHAVSCNKSRATKLPA